MDVKKGDVLRHKAITDHVYTVDAVTRNTIVLVMSGTGRILSLNPQQLEDNFEKK